VCHSPAPPTIVAKRSDCKSVANLRDLYELNYHVLGRTSSLSYLLPFAKDSANQSLSPSSISEIVQTVKCSECGNATASGECRQCNAFYCRRCFDAVHKRSRVLKSHIFRNSTEQDSSFSKKLRVGDQYFTLPSQNLCIHHRMPKDKYCMKCYRSHCQICSTVHHSGHRIRKLIEIVSIIFEILKHFPAIFVYVIAYLNVLNKILSTLVLRSTIWFQMLAYKTYIHTLEFTYVRMWYTKIVALYL